MRLKPSDEVYLKCNLHHKSGHRRKIDVVNPEKHFNKIKDLFCDFFSYKWKITKGLNYIRSRDLEVEVLTNYLRDFRIHYIEHTKSDKKLKGFLNFIENLEKNKKIVQPNNPRKQINLKQETDIEDFLISLYDISEHLDCKHSNVINWISSTIKLPVAKSTFKRKYYDGIKDAKK